MENVKRKSVNDKLRKYDYLCNKDDYDFIEVTEWTNGEGWDITIGKDNSNKLLWLSRGELDAIDYLTKRLEYEDD